MVTEKLTQKIGQKCFSVVHQKNLVYNTCWEDPRLDREALNLSSQDRVLVITSAGCNALDYALQGPANVFAVDMNPLQNALLELKIACIRSLNYSDFFQVFGCGHHQDWSQLYWDAVRQNLSPVYRQVWDQRANFFDGSTRRKSFYYRGTSGFFAWLINVYMNRPAGLREAIGEILEAESVQQQRQIYESRNVDELLWRKPIRWVLRRDTTMAMLGVPKSQRKQIDQGYAGGIAAFIQDRIEAVFKTLPLKDNYFWRVYMTGRYTSDCCPEYLKQSNFDSLKSGLVERISTHSDTVEGFLAKSDHQVTRFVLLDHMDWLWEHHPDSLRAEWQQILERSGENARVLWRSAALNVDFVDPLSVMVDGHSTRLGELLNYDDVTAAALHELDRVHTYGSFYIADIAA